MQLTKVSVVNSQRDGPFNDPLQEAKIQIGNKRSWLPLGNKCTKQIAQFSEEFH